MEFRVCSAVAAAVVASCVLHGYLFSLCLKLKKRERERESESCQWRKQIKYFDNICCVNMLYARARLFNADIIVYTFNRTFNWNFI